MWTDFGAALVQADVGFKQGKVEWVAKIERGPDDFTFDDVHRHLGPEADLWVGRAPGAVDLTTPRIQAFEERIELLSCRRRHYQAVRIRRIVNPGEVCSVSKAPKGVCESSTASLQSEFAPFCNARRQQPSVATALNHFKRNQLRRFQLAGRGDTPASAERHLLESQLCIFAGNSPESSVPALHKASERLARLADRIFVPPPHAHIVGEVDGIWLVAVTTDLRQRVSDRFPIDDLERLDLRAISRS